MNKTNNLIPFTFDNLPLRTIKDEQGSPLFVAKDVAEILGYKNTSKAVKDHCKGETKHYPLYTEGGRQDLRVIEEPDVYRLIFGSKLEGAERFQNFVFNEVLPSIRKHGMWAKEDLINNPDFLLEVATQLKTEREQRLLAEIERDKAIRAKGQISSAREASVMAKLGNTKRQLTKVAEENRRLKERIDEDDSYYTILRMEKAYPKMKGQFKWSVLKQASEVLNLPLKTVETVNTKHFGKVNAYHKDVWRKAYNVFLSKPEQGENEE